MNLLRKLLRNLRTAYNTSSATRNRALILLSLISAALIAAAVLVDLFVPHAAIWNLIRTAIVAPLGLALFSLFYMVGLFMHYRQSLGTDGWVPFRERMSPAWRRRVSLIMFAVGVVVTFGASGTATATSVSALLVAEILALLAFIRLTRDEQKREELQIPDSRDVAYSLAIEEAAAKRKLRREMKETEKENKKSNSLLRQAFKK